MKEKTNVRSKQMLATLLSRRGLLAVSLWIVTSNGWAVDSNLLIDKTETITEVVQQKRTIKGTVKDALNEPIIGASVIIKGSSTGTITDLDGNFSLQASETATLQISYIGYLTQEIKIGTQTAFDIKLKEDNQTLDEVVVVGYGTQKKVNLTGAVSTVNFEEQAASRPVTNVSSALAGLSAGVQVMQGSGQPGSDGATIRVRGTGTLNNANPIVLIDGMEGILDAVNPQDIENISILKDAASCAIYGSRGANGVVLVTTKKGKKDRVNVNYSGRISYSQPSNTIDLVNNYADFMELMNEGYTNGGYKPIFEQSTIDTWREKEKDPNALNELGVPNYVAYPNTDWQKYLFENSLIHDQNVSVSGGAERISFLFSAGYLDNPGLVKNTGIKRYQLRGNIEAEITKWLTVGTRMYAQQQDREPAKFGDANEYLYQTTPGVYPEWNGRFGAIEAKEESQTANNIGMILKRNSGTNRESRFNTTFYSKIKLIKGLTWDFNFNYMRRIDEVRSWNSDINIGRVRFSDGVEVAPSVDPSKMSTSFSNYSNYSYTLENILNYHTTINKVHELSALAGYHEYYYYEFSSNALKEGLIDPSINVPDAATEMKSIGGNAKDRARRSFFGRVNYAYQSRYLLEANMRYDGNSRYHKDSRWGVFPSFSAGWRISEEGFMKNTSSWLDNLKLRGSWGKLGNDGGDKVGDYEYQAVYNLANYSFNGVKTSGLASTSVPNILLQWEGTATTNVGIDANFLDNRLSFTADYYNKFTNGILYQPTIYLTMGQKSAPRLNIAEVNNKGFEVAVGWRDQIKEFTYSVSVNMAYNKNEVSKYKGEYSAGWVEENGQKVWKTNIGDVSTGGANRVVEGKPINEFYLKSPYKGTGNHFNSDGTVNKNGGPKDGMIRTEKDMEWIKAMIASGYTFMPNQKLAKDKLWYGDYIYADANGDGIYGSDFDNEFQGTSTMPKYNFGLQASASWKGFDISMNWAGAAGFKLYWGPNNSYNATNVRLGFAINKEIADNHYYYDSDNPSNPRNNVNGKFPRYTTFSGNNQVGSTRFLHKGDYLKLKNLTFGYTLPKRMISKLSIQSARFYVSGENLLNFNSFPGQDPELGAYPTYTSLRTFALGTNITF